jgi:NAD(P)H-dependent flavin oxidoreductase YrpB (nitropropane dioxygenase family)
MPPRWNENRLTAKLGIDYPVIQGPLGGLQIRVHRSVHEDAEMSTIREALAGSTAGVRIY